MKTILYSHSKEEKSERGYNPRKETRKSAEILSKNRKSLLSEIPASMFTHSSMGLGITWKQVHIAIYLSALVLFHFFAYTHCDAIEWGLPDQNSSEEGSSSNCSAEECISSDPNTHSETLSTDTSDAISHNTLAEKAEQVFQSTEASANKNENIIAAILEVRASYFRPFSSTFRKLIHGGGGVNYSLEMTVPFWKGWNIWGEVDYFSKSGSMIGIHRSVHITMVPIILGLKYIYWFNRSYGLYIGGAGKYYFVEIINRVFPIHKTTHRDGLGSVYEIGNLFCFNHFVVDIFSSWSFKTIQGLHHLPPNATSSNLHLGGWNIGIGLGHKF